MKAVLDRFEGEFAVVLVGEDEVHVNMPKSLLPHGAREGSWLKLNIELDPEATERQREKISELLAKLKK
ncbi:MAG: DUF3006 domain-containing protein [Bacillota bacterium]|nr:DUF3006 domain-containing protein [Bacillota bacterium]